MLEPYHAVAPFYDVLSGEWPIYRAGRVAGIRALRLSPGDTVVDVGCGTGLSLPLLSAAVGPRGHVIAMDASQEMLAVATRRSRRLPSRFTLLQADATTPSTAAWDVVTAHRPTAVLFTYSLSVMRPWSAAWELALAAAAPAVRVTVVDMALPSGRARVFRPLARAACRLGRADIAAHPWRAIDLGFGDVEHQRLRGGHIRAVSGTRIAR